MTRLDGFSGVPPHAPQGTKGPLTPYRRGDQHFSNERLRRLIEREHGVFCRLRKQNKNLCGKDFFANQRQRSQMSALPKKTLVVVRGGEEDQSEKESPHAKITMFPKVSKMTWSHATIRLKIEEQPHVDEPF